MTAEFSQLEKSLLRYAQSQPTFGSSDAQCIAETQAP